MNSKYVRQKPHTIRAAGPLSPETLALAEHPGLPVVWSTRMRPARRLNLTARDHKANPFPAYAYLRWASPVQWIALPDGRTAWLVTRYKDVIDLLLDGRFVELPSRVPIARASSDFAQIPALVQPIAQGGPTLGSLTNERVETLLATIFAPPRLDTLAERSRAACQVRLEELRKRERVELIAEYARPVTASVMADLLGAPAAEQDRLTRWLGAIASVNESSWRAFPSMPWAWQFVRYLRSLIRAQRRQPTLNLLSALLEHDGGPAPLDGQIAAIVLPLLLVGYEATVNLIGNGVLTLLQHADQLTRLRTEPALLASSVEELLRFSSPFEIAERYAGQDIWIAGVEIPRGDLVLAALASANRDHRQFPEPDVLDLGRTPNRHVLLEAGLHHRFMAPLIRLVGRVAIGTLLESGDFVLAEENERLRWRRELAVRGLESLPLRAVRWSY